MPETKKKIAVVAPACALTREAAEKVSTLAASLYGARLSLDFHPQCFLREGHFAGSDEARGAAFLEAANDPAYDAIWFARGGYGAMRLDDAVFQKLNDAARQKIFLGYSDLGAVLARLYRDKVGRPVHGPMPADIAREGGEAAVTRALKFLVEADPETLEPTARGARPVAAFNLTVLSHLIGTPWMPDLGGHILIVEDVSEYMYRIDRAFFSVTSNPRLRQCAGVMLGRISDIPGNDPDFQQTEEDVAQYWCARAGLPFLGRADIGHDAENKVVPFGGPAAATA